jgi:hypothetical protein
MLSKLHSQRATPRSQHFRHSLVNDRVPVGLDELRLDVEAGIGRGLSAAIAVSMVIAVLIMTRWQRIASPLLSSVYAPRPRWILRDIHQTFRVVMSLHDLYRDTVRPSIRPVSSEKSHSLSHNVVFCLCDCFVYLDKANLLRFEWCLGELLG